VATENSDKRFHLEEVREVITGFVTEGTGALMTLIGEATKLLVIAGLMWGGGDITVLLIDAGHDLRVARILLGRINASMKNDPIEEPRPARSSS
jgi:hypothetical protein